MIHRVRQALLVLGQREDPPAPPVLTATPRTARLFATLAPHDRRHLVAVHEACVERGLSDEVALAGLFHDIGKVSLSGRRVTLLDRSLRVVLRRVGPVMLSRLARVPATRWRHGLLLAEHHPCIGADRLAALGWSAQVVAAVRDHEGEHRTGPMAELRAIDDATP